MLRSLVGSEMCIRDSFWALQVLSDPRMRRVYDSAGQEGLGRPQVWDAMALFELLFQPGGCAAWKLWIGELHAVTLAELADTPLSHGELSALFSWKQKAREIGASVHLAGVLDRFHGDVQDFADFVDQKLLPPLDLDSALSTAMLGVLGGIFKEQSQQALAGGVCGATTAGLRESANGYRTQLALVTAAARIGVCIWNAWDDDALQPNEQQQQAILCGILEAAFTACVLEVEATLRICCWNVLHDRGENENVLRHRGEAMEVLADRFDAHGCSWAEGIQGLKQRLFGETEGR
eukprot:TRINITY_DN60925_c0_g1_i1.p1 TRINITY_DN60925_c0_g1~~TRINITY_DN60925_c0_g1_i1.p1  ORF type:complete len:316 (-),score=80.11 TRINITY_DN60925_c0_g1_i1:129-1004(-)